MATIARAAREAVSERRGNRPDWILFATMVVLAIFGLVMIYSATRSSGTFSMERQMIFVAAGIVLYLVASMIDYREYRALIPYLYGGIIVLVMNQPVHFMPGLRQRVHDVAARESGRAGNKRPGHRCIRS